MAAKRGLRKANFSSEEVAMLVEEITKCARHLFRPASSRAHIFHMQKLWRNICHRLNATHHHYRDSEDLRTKWRELKRKVSFKQACIAKKRSSKQLSLTQVEQQILKIMADTSLSEYNCLDTSSSAVSKREESTVPQELLSCLSNVVQQEDLKPDLEEQQQQPGSTKGWPVQDEFLSQGAIDLMEACEPMAENKPQCSYRTPARKEESRSQARVAASLPSACATIQQLSSQNDRIVDLLGLVKGELSRIGDIMEIMLEQMMSSQRSISVPSPTLIPLADVLELLAKLQPPSTITSNVVHLRQSARLQHSREPLVGVRKRGRPRKHPLL
uniref:Uncharacterized protein LOC117362752 n=1 Tax=Geotrypetes seraphini TaxID=260995 RepID=A0A6P8R5Z5_GEOSA|nr:uncharacterized protein LOC117362752 [Geotrypetes seraphini]